MLETKIQESCGVVGVIAPRGADAAPIAAKLGAELQHRGQEGAGMVTKSLGGEFHSHRGGKRFGLVFGSSRVLSRHNLNGEIALAHTRYRTTGPAEDHLYAQPMVVSFESQTLAGGHNGNIANADEFVSEIYLSGGRLTTKESQRQEKYPFPVSDSEVIYTRIAMASGDSWPEKIANGVKGLEGAFSLVIATDQDELIALRDPWAIRPLSFGRIDGHFVVASETFVLDKFGAVDQTEVGKGEMWIFRSEEDPQRQVFDNTHPQKYCDFEDWYFSWPSSRRAGVEVTQIREVCGEVLAEEELRSGRLVNANLVTCVPDTGRSGAGPFAEKLGLPYRDRIYKERYDDKGIRSFIGSSEILRVSILEDKYLISRSLEGQIVYILDDTAVRLKTIEILNRALKDQVGVRETHWRFLAPKFVRPCRLGVNIHDREELGATVMENGLWVVKDNRQIAAELEADSVAFLTLTGRERVRRKFGESIENFCGYCHGDNGPDFDMSKYDRNLRFESRGLVARDLIVV